jgi:dipeptidyl aminopeptidase/acylaminoacyl peptidase
LKRSLFDRISLARVRRITAGHDDHEQPAWSPDGRFIAFTAGPYGAMDIYLVDRRGRFARRLTDGALARGQPAWSPDGTRIAYRSEGAGIRLVALDGRRPIAAGEGEKAPALIAEALGMARQPAWSPDGRRLAYSTDEGSPGRFRIAVLEVESGRRQLFTGDPERNDCHPAWSPDGRRIAFHAYEGKEAERAQIHILDPASGACVKLTRGRGFSKHPAFLRQDLLVFHREAAGPEPELVLLDLGNGRERPLGTGKHPAAIARGGGRARLAFAAREEARPRARGVRAPFDIFTAEIDLP